MKKVVVVFLFLMFFVSFAAAGDILVKSQKGNEVVVNIWPGEFTAMVASEKGLAGVNDSFSASLPGISSGTYTVQVFVRISGRTYKKGVFYNQSLSESLVIDCISNSSCLLGVEEVVEPVVNDSVPVVNDSVVNNNVSDNASDDVIESVGSVGFVAKGYDVVVDNSVISFGVIPLVLALFIFMIVRRGKSVRHVAVESDDELEDIEEKMKETEEKIKSIKTKKARGKNVKIKAAKKKLAEEEMELKELEKDGADSDDIEEQKEDVEEAKEDVEEAEVK